MTSFIFSPKFNKTLDQSIAHIGLYNTGKAIEFVQRVDRLTTNIVEFPESYRTRSYLPAEMRRCSFRISARYPDEYAIFYEFLEVRDHVIFHAVFPGFFDFYKIFRFWQ